MNLFVENNGIQLYLLDAIHQDRINLGSIIVGENKDTTRQIKGYIVEIGILKFVVLGEIRQLHQNRIHFSSMGRITHLVQLIKINDWIHTFTLYDTLHDLAILGSHIGETVAL